MVCTQPAPVNVVISSKPSLSGAQLGDACAVAVAVGVGDGVPVEVAVAVGVAPVMVILPFVWAGVWVSRFSSMKKKLSGACAQVSGVL